MASSSLVLGVRVLGLSSRAAVISVLVGALPGLLYVWGPWRSDPERCTTLGDGTRVCMPMLVVPPPLWAYLAVCYGGAQSAGLVVTFGTAQHAMTDAAWRVR